MDEDATSFEPERFLDTHGRVIRGHVEARNERHLTYAYSLGCGPESERVSPMCTISREPWARLCNMGIAW